MISIITPTYNRAHTLPSLYKSLCCQIDRDFEWVVVDDGSTDDTEIVVKKWEEDNNLFPIHYVKQENGGKHRALNKGISLSKGEYIFIVDSDDYLTPDAVSFINSHINEVSNEEYAGLSGLRGWIDKDGTIGNLPEDDKYLDIRNSERKKYGLKEDKAEVYKASVLKSHPFPEFQGEKFIWEGSVWDKLDKEGYILRWYNHVIYKCKYREDGLTNNISNEFLSKNFQGLTYCTKQSLALGSFRDRVCLIEEYIEVTKIKGLKLREIETNLNINSATLYFAYGVLQLKKIIKKVIGRKA